MALVPGSTAGPYRIMEPLGRGGMASVYRAYEPALDRYVALKVLPREFLHDASFAERFRREAQVVARLEHPNIVPIYAFDIDKAEGLPWMAMRLVPGGSLAQLIRKERLPPSRTVEILRGVAEALDYAHGKGIVHRDVKPQNVLLDESGRVYLADFGIAKILEASGGLTATGMITGTPQYMAPEQATAAKIGPSADVYALGIVAYEMLTGRVPFAADTPVAVLMKHVQEPLPIPSPDSVSEALVRPVLKCTAKKPEERWPSAGAFVTALEDGVAATAAIPVSPTLERLGAAPTTEWPANAAPTLRSPEPSAAPTPPLRAGTPVPPSPPGGIGTVAWLGIGVAGAFVVLLAGIAVAFLLLRRPATSTSPAEPPPPRTSQAEAVPLAPGPHLPEPTLAPEPPALETIPEPQPSPARRVPEPSARGREPAGQRNRVEAPARSPAGTAAPPQRETPALPPPPEARGTPPRPEPQPGAPSPLPHAPEASLAAQPQVSGEVVRLSASLRDGDPTARWRAAQALGALRGEAAVAVPALASALDDRNSEVRWRAAEALGRIGAASGGSVPSLSRRLTDADPLVRVEAAKALGLIGPSAANAVAALAQTLGSSEVSLRREAARALARIGAASAPALRELTGALKDKDKFVRMEAARALGRMGPLAREAVPALAPMVRDSEQLVAREAQIALRAIGNGSATESGR